jgi:hypothetical protein
MPLPDWLAFEAEKSGIPIVLAPPVLAYQTQMLRVLLS